MTHSRENVWKMFDAISTSYDRINSILSFGMDSGWRKRAATHLPEQKNLDLLDLASGTGDQLIACMENGADIRSAIGIDLASVMLEKAHAKVESKSYKDKVKFQHADATHIPFSDNSFDAATFSFGIRNVSDPMLALKEIHRVLKPGGRCLILEFSLPKEPIKTFHLFYLRRILPHIGGFFSKNKAAYRYLNETIETFPCGPAFCLLMKNASFSSIRQIPMSLGAVTLYLGDKRVL
jgi:demethylmenaquinone methyltransferase / 2-methoxy-6-polyprenyl-1,4-benzoquinol methylase